MNIKLSEIARVLGTKIQSDKIVKKISIDSRDVDENTIFFAIKGDRFDGHDFVCDVAKKGVCAVVCHKKVECDVPVIYVDDTKSAFLNLAKYYRQKNKNLLVVGLTGSVGKTTTKEMTAYVMSQKFKTLKTEGNLNNEIGVPKTLFRLSEDTECAIVEMGMDAKGQIEKLTSCAMPDCAIITNIGVSHIENLGSRENILKAKLEILKGMKKGSYIFLNGDNDLLNTVENKDFKIIKFGIENKDCDVVATYIEENDYTTSFYVSVDDTSQRIIIPTVGIHNVYDALAAFAVGYYNGMKTSDIADGLLNYKPSGMRQNITKHHGITVIEDCYNASPDSQRAGLNTLCKIAEGKKVAILGDMLELGDYSKEAHRKVGEYAAECGVDFLYTFGEQAKFIADGAYRKGLEHIYIYVDKEHLIADLKNHVQVGDTLLFKASRGMKLEEVFEELYKYWEV